MEQPRTPLTSTVDRVEDLLELERASRLPDDRGDRLELARPGLQASLSGKLAREQETEETGDDERGNRERERGQWWPRTGGEGNAEREGREEGDPQPPRVRVEKRPLFHRPGIVARSRGALKAPRCKARDS